MDRQSQNTLSDWRVTSPRSTDQKSILSTHHTPQTVAFAMGAVAGYHAATTMPSAEEVQKASDKIVNSAKAIAEQYNLKITQIHVERGEAAEHIVACAEACGADLIVTGRRGLGSVGSLLQGSTTLQVNHLAKCACLSVV